MKIKINDIKSLDLIPLGSRSLSLIMNNCNAIEERESFEVLDRTVYTEKINKLKFHGTNEHSISIGDDIKIDNIVYNVSKITPGEKINQYIILDTDINKSTKYILPFTAPPGVCAGNYLFNKCLYNTYLNCIKYPDFEVGKYLFLKYRFYDNNVYKKLEYEITGQKNYVLTDDSQSGFTIFVLEIPKEYQETVTKLIFGEYGNIDIKHKQVVINFYNPDPTKAGNFYRYIYKQVKDVLHRDKDAKHKLEKSLDIKLSEFDDIESKPKIIDEMLIL